MMVGLHWNKVQQQLIYQICQQLEFSINLLFCEMTIQRKLVFITITLKILQDSEVLSE